MEGKILMYHYVRQVNEHSDPLGYRLSVKPNELDHHIEFLQSHGYHPISMADLATGKGDDHAVALTFDDGYEDFYTEAVPILKKHGWTATVYVITGKIGDQYLTWDQVRQLHADGFEIGAHTVNHHDLSKLSESDQRHEIADSKKKIEDEIGAQVTTFAYPSGKYNETSVRLVKEAGYLTAVTTHPGAVVPNSFDPFTLQRFRMNPDMGDSLLADYFN
jgi:peptidoglycan/xylan/chitin deacetylase (PgdA/CDA1 family)